MSSIIKFLLLLYPLVQHVLYDYGFIRYLVFDDIFFIEGRPIIDPFSHKYLIEMSQYVLLPLYSFIRLFVYSFDVIHTLGFYSRGIKIDAIPGRINLTTTLRLL